MAEKMLEKGTFSILIVEDDRDMNDLLKAILGEAGYKTRSAFDGEAAIEVAKRERPNLVLLDIMLPKVDGVEVCRRLSSMDETKNIPVIMLTIKRELSVKLASYIAGARRFITKPFGVEEVLNEIRNTLKQSQLSGQIDLIES